MGLGNLYIRVLGFLGVAVPLAGVLYSVVTSPWFNLLSNALSDLGHALRSEFAVVFNLSLATGGILIVTYSVLSILSVDRFLGLLAFFTGYSLTLIAVFDEVYGYVHLVVSVIFFILILVASTYYAARYRVYYIIPLVAVSVISWVLHYGYGIPEGVAIPELVSIVTALSWYLHAVLKLEERESASTFGVF